MNTYQLDTEIQIFNQFETETGIPMDPTAVTLFVKTPDGVVTTYTGSQLTQGGVGLYTLDILVDQVGPWIYNWQGTGMVEITTGDVYFLVAQSAVLPGGLVPAPTSGDCC